MSKNINLSIIGNDNKKNEEIIIENPKTLDGLLISINRFIKDLPDYFTIFYKSDNKEIDVKNNEDINLSNGMLYIRPKNPNDIEGSIFKKVKTDENNKIDDSGKEKEQEQKKNEISENITFVDKTVNFFKDVVNKIKKIELPISIPFLSSDNNLPYSCIPRIDSEYPDLSYDNMDKE